MLNRLKHDFSELLQTHKAKVPYVVAIALIVFIYLVSKGREEVTRVYQSTTPSDFKDARVLGSQGQYFYENKERLLSKTVKDLQEAQVAFRDTTAKLEARLSDIEKSKAVTASDAQAKPLGAPGDPPSSADGALRLGPAAEELEARRIQGKAGPSQDSGSLQGNSGVRFATSVRGAKGASVISFPVKEVSTEKTTGVVVPPGSYVKAKLMTGVEAPEGKTYPVLMQLDYAYIVPNKKRLDLSGCFMIAKSQGDLSTERVQMQATKLSCVSQDGKMFERDVNGFVADDKDNSFAVMGSVTSKQDRVAAMAFLSSVVEGVGKSLQQAQTTQNQNPLGGTSSIISGSQLGYLGGGGAANAAGMVTQWYLRQAQNLLPTINIGSGQDVWIVMQETVRLPNDYFRKNQKGGSDESVYSYFSRLGE